MKLNENILKFRKERGFSQETLAEKVDVSRQTISNWELGETSPNPDQLISLSNAFEVSVDVLLGKEEERKEDKPDARIFTAIGTALNFIGLITSIMIWFDKQDESAIAVGLIIMAIGCMTFVIGQIIGKNKKNNILYFIGINIWILLLIPHSCIFNMIDATLGSFYYQLTPIPQLNNSYFSYSLAWIIYIIICATVDVIVYLKIKNNNK